MTPPPAKKKRPEPSVMVCLRMARRQRKALLQAAKREGLDLSGLVRKLFAAHIPDWPPSTARNKFRFEPPPADD